MNQGFFFNQTIGNKADDTSRGLYKDKWRTFFGEDKEVHSKIYLKLMSERELAKEKIEHDKRRVKKNKNKPTSPKVDAKGFQKPRFRK